MGAAPVQATVMTWQFPIKRPHAGPVLANRLQGLMIWGEGNKLNITFAHAGFWDHRGGRPFRPEVTYDQLAELVAKKDEEAIKRLFQGPEPALGEPKAFRQIGGGRVELTLDTMYRLEEAKLDLMTAQLTVTARHRNGGLTEFKIWQAAHEAVAQIDLPKEFHVGARIIPAHELVAPSLQTTGIERPAIILAQGFKYHGAIFYQKLPDGTELEATLIKGGEVKRIETKIRPSVLKRRAPEEKEFNPDIARTSSTTFWRDYYANIARLELPDPVLQQAWDYGVYKLGSVTGPDGPACTLQGPLMEDYQVPPWGNDYHWNINIQMIYEPLLALGKAGHFKPLVKMLNDWLPTMQANGKAFFGRPGTVMLPHATDDRGYVSGTFWTGHIDHGSTAWVALLAYDYARYSGDKDFLKSTALPLLRGALAGYEAMLKPEEDAAGKPTGRLYLPVSVSPEYGGKQFSAVGANASYQLAAIHALEQALLQAEGRQPQLTGKVPFYSLYKGPYMLEYPGFTGQRIGLWEGMDLPESHRHHSHLAGIWPFRNYSIYDTTHTRLIENSLRRWVLTGTGNWSGWSYPAAAHIAARTNRADAAVHYLHQWHSAFVNEGGGTLHDAAFAGVSHQYSGDHFRNEQNREKMQLDAAAGVVGALMELVVQQHGAVTHILPQLPQRWRRMKATNIHTANGLVIDVLAEDGQLVAVKVKATRALSKPQLKFDLAAPAQLAGPGNWREQMKPGDVVLLARPGYQERARALMVK